VDNHDDWEGQVRRARMTLLALTCARGSQSTIIETRYAINGDEVTRPLEEAEQSIARYAKPLACDGRMEGRVLIVTFSSIPQDELESHKIGAREQIDFFRRQLDRVKPTGMRLTGHSPVLFGRSEDFIEVLFQDLDAWFPDFNLKRRSFSIGAAPIGTMALGVVTIGLPPEILGFSAPS
jgi:hypothetical protein